jgi:hypothetical protein
MSLPSFIILVVLRTCLYKQKKRVDLEAIHRNVGVLVSRAVLIYNR